jgi:hypothetical protein
MVVAALQWAQREQTLSLGTYPEIALAEARSRGTAVRKQVALVINPSATRQEAKVAERLAAERTYSAILGEWLPKTATARKWTADRTERVRRRFDVHFVPWLGRKDIATVTDDDILGCIGRMEGREPDRYRTSGAFGQRCAVSVCPIPEIREA